MTTEYYAWGTDGFSNAKAALGAIVPQKDVEHTDLLDGIGVECTDGKPVWDCVVTTALAIG